MPRLAISPDTLPEFYNTSNKMGDFSSQDNSDMFVATNNQQIVDRNQIDRPNGWDANYSNYPDSDKDGRRLRQDRYSVLDKSSENSLARKRHSDDIQRLGTTSERIQSFWDNKPPKVAQWNLSAEKPSNINDHANKDPGSPTNDSTKIRSTSPFKSSSENDGFAMDTKNINETAAYADVSNRSNTSSYDVGDRRDVTIRPYAFQPRKPNVTIKIGRVDVRAILQERSEPSSLSRSVKNLSPSLSLQDYLKQRSEGRR